MTPRSTVLPPADAAWDDLGEDQEEWLAWVWESLNAGPAVPAEDQDEVLAREIECLDGGCPMPAQDQDAVPGEESASPGWDVAGRAGLGRAGLGGAALPGSVEAGFWDRSGGQGWGFSAGGAADMLPPGPVLAGLVEDAWQAGLGTLIDDELIGALGAQHRLASRAAAGELAVVAELASRREARAGTEGVARALDHVSDEIAAALTLTRSGASSLLSLALNLGRLPLTMGALAAGEIDRFKAIVIVDEVNGLGDEHAAAVEAAIIGAAGSQTSGQLRAAVHRAVIAADPDAARKRKEQARRHARVEVWHEPSGTAGLVGRDLPSAGVLAADKRISAFARDLKAAGAAGTLSQLRAGVFLALLCGRTPASLLPQAGTGAPNPGGTSADGPSAGGSSASKSSMGWAGAGGMDAGGVGAGGVGAGGAEGSGQAAPPRPGGSGPGGSGPGGAGGLPVLGGSVNLTVPLSTWLGWSELPGQVPGYGYLDAEDSRAIAAALAANTATRWCLTLTGLGGHPVAHGCARKGPPPSAHGRQAEPAPPGGTGPPGGASAWGYADWLSVIRIAPLETGTCTHQHESPGYIPSRLLRHLIQIRQCHCSYPGCRRPATRCDLDHTLPYHKGGRSCWCNIAPVCRAHHRRKQAPGWALTQDRPGEMTWITPAGRRYTTGPASYPE